MNCGEDTLQRIDGRLKEYMRIPIEDKAHWTVSDELNGEEWERTHMFRLCDHDSLSCHEEDDWHRVL